MYESKREAEIRAKVLQRRDPNFHVFVGQVGYWLPWDPNPDGVAEQEYSNDQLNTLMKKYQENRKYRDDVYANETEERKKAAREENQTRKFYQPKTDEEMKEAEDKIRELRDIVNEKDRLYSKIEEAAAGKAPEAAPAAAPEGNGAEAVDLPVSGGGEVWRRLVCYRGSMMDNTRTLGCRGVRWLHRGATLWRGMRSGSQLLRKGIRCLAVSSRISFRVVGF